MFAHHTPLDSNSIFALHIMLGVIVCNMAGGARITVPIRLAYLVNHRFHKKGEVCKQNFLIPS